MKRIFFIFTSCSMLLLSACKKSELTQVNPNLPTPESSLTTEGGLIAFTAGLLKRTIYSIPNAGANPNILTVAMVNQAIAGDEQFPIFTNFGWQSVGQAYSITVPGVGVVLNANETTQQQQLQKTNNRNSGDLNAFQYEWTVDYFLIAQANTILSSLNNPALVFNGNAAIKTATLAAYAYWWKGWAYSRLGSTYLSAVIAPSNGILNPDFIDHNAIITEANANLDSCVAQLSNIDPASVLPDKSDPYSIIMSQIILAFNDNSNIVTPSMWRRQINTYKARNLLVNKKVANMQAADWQQIITWCENGLTATDFHFKFGMSATNPELDLSNGYLHPLAVPGPRVKLTYLSERLVQDFKIGDARFTSNVSQLPNPPAVDNTYGLSAFADSRFPHQGTRWAAVPVEDGGAWATGKNQGFVPFATTYEENQLMLAEAYIYGNQIDKGLTYIDQVRSFQNANLSNVSGTGLTLDVAKEELRKERRIGLCQRGLAFFDARRWGVTQPAANGGGRADAIVYLPGSLINSTTDKAEACFIEYNYMDYWDVPQNELDFNTPSAGSAAVKN